MPKLRRALSAVLIPLPLVLQACGDQPSAPDPPSATVRASAPQSGTLAGHIDYDERLAQLVDDLPGFAGFFYGDGRMVVRLKEGTSTLEEAKVAVADFLERNTRGGPASVRERTKDMVALQADFDFRELHGWYQYITRDILPLGGINWSDIDERENRIVIGVRDGDRIDLVRSLVADLPLPSEAVIVQHAPGFFVPDGDLQGTVRPVVGGPEIEGQLGGQTCSLGFNAHRAHDEAWYFVTASHCTNSQQVVGGVDGELFGQPTPEDIIGEEAYDPPLFTNAEDTRCPVGDECRYSDAAAVRYTMSDWSQGLVAWPTSWPWTLFSSTVYVVTEGDAAQGEQVHKIGRTTGRTAGSVLRTCTDVEYPGLHLLCAWIADYASEGGDSGAPVVVETATADEVRSVGIHTGRNLENQSEGVFSSLTDVMLELDGWWCTTIDCAPDPHVLIVSGPDSIPGPPPPEVECTWSASASGGTAPYSYMWSGVASGSGSSIREIVTSSGWLKVTITDYAGHQDTNQRYITVDENASLYENCEEMW